MSGWMVRYVRRRISSPELYGLLRSGLLLWQRLIRRPEEPDLLFLARLPDREGELILDIGANGGQTAVALSFIRPDARILSYEPLPMLWPELKRVRRMLGSRFDFRRFGLSARAGRAVLHVPVTGRLPITTRASLSEAGASEQCRILAHETGLPTSVSRVEIELRRGDDEDLAPSAIKIDVEGSEMLVLEGFSRIIETHRPVIFLERSSSFTAGKAFLIDRNYVVYVSDCQSHDEVRLSGLSSRNWIAVPREMADQFHGQASR